MRRLGVVIGVGAFALLLVSCVPPVLVTGPTLSGQARVGEAIVVSPGEWLLAGTYGYQWQRCEADNTGCSNIPGGTGKSYTAVAADQGKRLRARVSNTNEFGAQATYTASSGIVEAPQSGPRTTHASVSSEGTQADLHSGVWSSTSADARYVAFASDATNLVPNDTNGVRDAFIRDTHTDTTTRASLAADGAQGNAASTGPSLSADGRYLAFGSAATNLVPGDTNNRTDLFVRDNQTGATTWITGPGGVQGNSDSFQPTLSSDGRYVAFYSFASTFVATDVNVGPDAFLHDTQTGTTTLVSVASDGTQGNSTFIPSVAISGDGRSVAFTSTAPNLVPGDTNGAPDVFVHHADTGVTTRVSVASDGTQGNNQAGWSSLSGNGRYVAFESASSNLVADDTNATIDVFVHDTQTATTTRASVPVPGIPFPSGLSLLPTISDDGRHVAFASYASNLVAGDTSKQDVFVRDMQTGTTSRVSVAPDGTPANADSTYGVLSGDGSTVVFNSTASNLVPGDTNGVGDVFVHDRG